MGIKSMEFDKAFNEGWNKLFDELLLELEPFDVEIAEAKEKYGILSIFAYSQTNDAEVQNIIRKYEEKSQHICEVCGDKGKTTTELGWTKTLCKECFQKLYKLN